MSTSLEVRLLELLTARICHELAGSISAVVNGVELITEEDPDFAADALRLVGSSARTASRRLQFYRFAYGSLPGEGTPKSHGRDLAMKFFEGGNVECDWPESETGYSVELQRLACVLLVAAAEALPRGGTVALRGLAPGLLVEATGETVRMLPDAQAGFRPDLAIENLTARGVHANLCQRFAATLKLKLAVAPEPRRLLIEAVPDHLP